MAKARVIRFDTRRGRRPLRTKRRANAVWLPAAAVFAVTFAAALSWPDPAAVMASATERASRGGDDVVGRVTRVTDGDTLRFGETRVRLHGVDAPEMSTPEGVEARRRLTALIGGGEVRCRDTGGRSYDRVVAVCFDARGRDLAAMMVETGWALDWPRYSGGRYAGHQRRAQAAGAGLHASEAPLTKEPRGR